MTLRLVTGDDDDQLPTGEDPPERILVWWCPACGHRRLDTGGEIRPRGHRRRTGRGRCDEPLIGVVYRHEPGS